TRPASQQHVRQTGETGATALLVADVPTRSNRHYLCTAIGFPLGSHGNVMSSFLPPALYVSQAAPCSVTLCASASSFQPSVAEKVRGLPSSDTTPRDGSPVTTASMSTVHEIAFCRSSSSAATSLAVALAALVSTANGVPTSGASGV